MTNLIDKKALLKSLNFMLESNYEVIEAGEDGDDWCKHEADTLENIIDFIEGGKYDLKGEV